MHIFLVILKIIGITVLVLLGIIVTLSLLILFVPVRYRVRADFDNDARIVIHLKWLVGIFRFKITYPKEKAWVFRAFGIPIVRGGRTKRKKKRIRAHKAGGSPEPAESHSEKETTVSDTSHDTTAKDSSVGGEKIKPHVGDKKKRRQRNGKINKKKRRGGNLIKTFFGVIGDETNKRIIIFLKDIIIRFLKRVKPKKIRADMVIGFEDPACTGLFFGGLGILTVCWRGKYNITPDFEEKILKGSVCAGGDVRFLHIFSLLIKIMLNEDIKRVMKKGKVNGYGG